MKKLYKINRQLLIKLRGTSFRPHLEYLTSAGLAPSRGAMQKLQTQALKHVALEDGNDSGSDDLNPASPPSCAGHEVTQEEHEADFSEKVYMNNPLTPFEPSVCFTYTQTSSDGTLH